MAIYRVQRLFSWFDVLKGLADKANKKIDPSWKTEYEREQEYYQQLHLDRERKRENLNRKVSSISRQHKIILDISSRVSKFEPKWGDGDEYPVLYINTYVDEKDDRFGNVCLGLQNEPEYHWNGKFWIDITDKDRKVYNLKQDILKFLKSERKQWEKVDYLDEDEIKEVLVYLDKLIGEINKSSL